MPEERWTVQRVLQTPQKDILAAMHRRVDIPDLFPLDRDMFAADAAIHAQCRRFGWVGSDLIGAVVINFYRGNSPAGQEKSVRHVGGSDVKSLNKISIALGKSFQNRLHLLMRRKVCRAMLGG